MAESRVTIVNPKHWLDERGHIPLAPSNLRNRALRVAQCIEYGGPLPRAHWRETLIACNRRPNGVACPGLLGVLKQSDDAILAFCLHCQSDEFLIYEWEETLWAEGVMEPVSIATSTGQPVEPQKAPGPESRDELLARTLKLLDSPLTPADLRRMVATARAPSDVVEAVLSSLRAPPVRASLERFIPKLIDLWNDIQAATPPRPPEPPRRAKIGPNERCPCGSGKKYKRCCMHDETVH